MSAHDMYREIILAHAQQPHHAGDLQDATDCVHRDNTTCGDAIDLCVIIREGRLVTLRHQSEGCAISTASASMMADALTNASIDEARRWVTNFRAFLTEAAPLEAQLEELEAFDGVRQFPARIKCALLAWAALDVILNKQ